MDTLSFQSLLAPEFLSALLAIVLIDLALAGDNALVIGLAARQVPPHLQKKVLLWGSIAAVLVRGVFTLFVVWLLKIPGFLLAGGLILLYVAWKLVQPVEAKEQAHALGVEASLRQAVTTIVVADAAMGVENVIAIGGAAHGNMLLVVLGLLISVPIIMFGSQLVLRLVDRFPHIITLGGAILAWTAVKMALGESFVRDWMAQHASGWKLLIYALAIGLIVLPVLWRNLKANDKVLGLLLGFLVVWLAGFGMLENHLEMHDIFSPQWSILEEIVDLAMWVGWIPLAIGLHRRLTAWQGQVQQSVR